MEVTRTLARFVIDHTASKVPQNVRHEAARSFLNWVGCAVGGAATRRSSARSLR